MPVTLTMDGLRCLSTFTRDGDYCAPSDRTTPHDSTTTAAAPRCGVGGLHGSKSSLSALRHEVGFVPAAPGNRMGDDHRPDETMSSSATSCNEQALFDQQLQVQQALFDQQLQAQQALFYQRMQDAIALSQPALDLQSAAAAPLPATTGALLAALQRMLPMQRQTAQQAAQQAQQAQQTVQQAAQQAQGQEQAVAAMASHIASLLSGLRIREMDIFLPQLDEAPDEPMAPVHGKLHAEGLIKQPGPPSVLGGLHSREIDIFLLQLDDAPDEPMAFVPKQPGLPSVLGGRRGREVDIFSVQLLLTRVKMSEELTKQLMLDLFEKHKVGVPLEHSMGLGGAGLGGAGWASGGAGLGGAGQVQVRRGVGSTSACKKQSR